MSREKKGRFGKDARLSLINLIGSLLMSLVFIYFCCFIGSYFLYTFYPQKWILYSSTIWTFSLIIFWFYALFYFRRIKRMSVMKANKTFRSSREKLQSIDVEEFGLLFYVGIFVFTIPVMSVLRFFFKNSAVYFPVEKASELDYMSMLWITSVVIAIDAVLLVIISWRDLKRKEDVIGIAIFVGATHIVFPFLTFGITAFVAFISNQVKLPLAISYGLQSALFFTAFAFVFLQTIKVHKSITSSDIEVIAPPENEPVFGWRWVSKTWPLVFIVSIDALVIGPSNLVFMERYSSLQFWTFFIWVGIAVFCWVLIAGLITLWIKAKLETSSKLNHLFEE